MIQHFFHCSTLTSINIPGYVTSIGDYAFYYCGSLKSINIPDSVTSIGDYAFYNCNSLTCVSFEGMKNPKSGKLVFIGTPINYSNPVHVHKGYEGEIFADKPVEKDDKTCWSTTSSGFKFMILMIIIILLLI